MTEPLKQFASDSDSDEMQTQEDLEAEEERDKLLALINYQNNGIPTTSTTNGMTESITREAEEYSPTSRLSKAQEWKDMGDSEFFVTTGGPSRYFIDPKKELKCSYCKHEGHIMKDCKENESYCEMCEVNHNPAYCASSELCFRCGNLGHMHKSNCCPEHTRRAERFCTRCRTKAHHSFDCPWIWRNYVFKPTPIQLLEVKNVTCYDCGDTDHYGDECPEKRGTTHGSGIVITAYSEHSLDLPDWLPKGIPPKKSSKKRDKRKRSNGHSSSKHEILEDRRSERESISPEYPRTKKDDYPVQFSRDRDQEDRYSLSDADFARRSDDDRRRKRRRRSPSCSPPRKITRKEKTIHKESLKFSYESGRSSTKPGSRKNSRY